jgi:glycosyltransferase involved in cell wall biosynthesis
MLKHHPQAPRAVFVNRFFHPDESATSQMLSDLAFALRDSGIAVEIICSRLLYSDTRAGLPPVETLRGVVIRRVWSTRYGRERLAGRAVDYATFYLACFRALLGSLRPGDTVIAMTDPPLISVLAGVAARLRGARLINWLQDVFPEVATVLGANPMPRPLQPLLRWPRNWSLRAAGTNVVLGGRMRELVLGLGVSSPCIRIIENWSDLACAPHVRADDTLLRLREGLQGKFVVGYSGNLGRAHEFQTVLDAAALLRTDPRIVFLMIGSGAGMRRMKESAVRAGLSNLRFLPYQPREQLADSLSAADVHWVSLNPGLEGLIVPSKAYGIMAAGRPLIFVGDADGETARLIRRARCGLVVTPGDAAAFAKALLDFATDADAGIRVGARGQEYFREYCSFEKALRQWQELLITPEDRVCDARAPSV